MDHHLAGEGGARNSRNGYCRKSVVTDTGRIALEVQDVAVSGFRQQVGKWQSVVGHRVLGWSVVGASQLHPGRQVRWPPKPYTTANAGISTTSADAT